MYNQLRSQRKILIGVFPDKCLVITFVFDDTNVSSNMSAVDSVLADYIPMLQLGLVDDVDATIDECVQKCYDAGLQNIYDEFYTQYDAWAATRE